jgi:hypothetical protein
LASQGDAGSGADKPPGTATAEGGSDSVTTPDGEAPASAAVCTEGGGDAAGTANPDGTNTTSSGESNNEEKRSEQDDIKVLDDINATLQSVQQEIDEVGDEIEIIPAVARTLTSPIPTDLQGFTFINMNYEEDPEGPIIDIGTHALSSSPSGRGSIVVLNDAVPEGAATAESPADGSATPFRVRTPMLRPSTPTVTIELKKEDIESSDSITGATDDPSNKFTTEETPDVAAAILEEGIDREELIANIKLSLDRRDKLKLKNTFLQNKLGEYFRRKRAEENHDGEKSATDQEQRYANCMSALTSLRSEYETLNSTNQKVVNECKVKLEERITEANAKTTEFTKFKKGVAVAAENSRTGKPLPLKVIEQLESTEARKEAEVVAVRLENIKLRNKLRRHEQLLRQKVRKIPDKAESKYLLIHMRFCASNVFQEELADGLHLIDFEQLKIENQTYNEKIEERNEVCI